MACVNTMVILPDVMDSLNGSRRRSFFNIPFVSVLRPTPSKRRFWVLPDRTFATVARFPASLVIVLVELGPRPCENGPV
eukprot:jgi/Psemu1/315896/fgenesh1_kg.2536_\